MYKETVYFIQEIYLCCYSIFLSYTIHMNKIQQNYIFTKKVFLKSLCSKGDRWCDTLSDCHIKLFV